MNDDELISIDDTDPHKVVPIKVRLLHELLARHADRKAVLLSVARYARVHVDLTTRQLKEALKELDRYVILSDEKSAVARRLEGQIKVMADLLEEFEQLLGAEPLDWLSPEWLIRQRLALKNTAEVLRCVPEVPT